MKMPEPITAPIPIAVRLHGPKVRRSFFSGSSEAAMSASILFVRKMLTVAAPAYGYSLSGNTFWPRFLSLCAEGGVPSGSPPCKGLALALALGLVTDLLLFGPAGHTRGAFRLGSRLLACRALQLLAFNRVGDVLRIHQFLFNPAYFSINFFNP